MTNPNHLTRNWLTNQTERAPAGDAEAPVDETPPGHGRLVPDAELNAPIHKVQGSAPRHVDETGNPSPNFHKIEKAPHGPVLHDLPTPKKQVITVGREGVPQAHLEPPLQTAAEPDTSSPAHSITAAQTKAPEAVHLGEPQTWVQGGSHRVVPTPQNGMPSAVHVVPQGMSSPQAAQFLAQQGMAQQPMQGHVARDPGNAVRVINPTGQQAAGPQHAGPMPTGKIIEQNEMVTIMLADEETTRREAKLAGMQMAAGVASPPEVAPGEIPQMEVPEDPNAGTGPVLGVTVLLTSHLRPHLLAAQIAALNAGARRPKSIWILAIGAGPHDMNAMAAHPHNIYGIGSTHVDRYAIAAAADTRYACILDEDCIPGIGWLEAAYDALVGGLSARIACAGSRLDEDGGVVASRGPVRHASGAVVAEDLGDEGRAAIVDRGERGWFWGLGAFEGPTGLDSVTVVLPYTDPATWGVTMPTEGSAPWMPAPFSDHLGLSWELVSERAATSLAVPGTLLDVPGAYHNAKLGRTLVPSDPEWSAEHFELVTGGAWHTPSESPLPPPAPEGGPVPGATKIAAHKGVAGVEDAGDAGDAGGTEGTDSPQLDTSSEGEAALKPALLFLEKGKYAWCACGKSGMVTEPLCDGSHKGTGHEPVLFEVEQDGDVVLCQCKKTSRAPYCDGQHTQVAKDPAEASTAGGDGDGSPEGAAR